MWVFVSPDCQAVGAGHQGAKAPVTVCFAGGVLCVPCVVDFSPAAPGGPRREVSSNMDNDR
jgi:hypothetical protein